MKYIRKIADRNEYQETTRKIEDLLKELKACKNGFRAQCIKQDIERLQTQLDEFDQDFEDGLC